MRGNLAHPPAAMGAAVGDSRTLHSTASRRRLPAGRIRARRNPGAAAVGGGFRERKCRAPESAVAGNPGPPAPPRSEPATQASEPPLRGHRRRGGKNGNHHPPHQRALPCKSHCGANRRCRRLESPLHDEALPVPLRDVCLGICLTPARLPRPAPADHDE